MQPVFQQGPLCGEEHVRRFGGVVPDLLIMLWQRVGFSGFADGAMWMIDPLEWAGAAAEMLRGVKVRFLEPGSLLVPVARSAFGQFWFWSPGHGVCLSVRPADGELDMYSDPWARVNADRNVFIWLASMKADDMNMYDQRDEGLFEQALMAYGPVNERQCYAFVPSILLGGPNHVDHIEKVGLRAHLKVLDMIGRGEVSFELGQPVRSIDGRPLREQ